MIGLVEILVVPLLLLAGLALAWVAARSFAQARRVSDVPLRAVRELAPGPAEVRGQMRATAPVETSDGTPAIAVRRVVGGTYVSSRRGRTTDFSITEEVRTSPIELTDESGTCTIALDRVLLVGERRRHAYGLEDFARRTPRSSRAYASSTPVGRS